ncbi:MAG: hypothetical protein ABR600_06215 [Actinomycetota bacterium]|nr:hypothetical protein [Actinomycetota bacterium]
MTSDVIETSVGPWRAAVLVGESRCRFEPHGWLTERELASEALTAPRSATVELRRVGGGIMPWALLAGNYEPGAARGLEVRVAHSGALSGAPAHGCVGLLGSSLASGLPQEFAEATLDGLVRFAPETNRSGLLVVDGGAYGVADSSQFAFEHAAGLLKSAIFGPSSELEMSAASLDQFLRHLDRDEP